MHLSHAVVASDMTYIIGLQSLCSQGNCWHSWIFSCLLKIQCFLSYTLLLVYLFTVPWLPASPGSWSTLCNVRNTSPSEALHCEQGVLMCSSHSFILSLLKSRSALLFINRCFTTPSVFPLQLTELHLQQSTTSFYDFCGGVSNNILCASEGGC